MRGGSKIVWWMAMAGLLIRVGVVRARGEEGPPAPAAWAPATNGAAASVQVVKPKQGTGTFAVWCPHCGSLEIVKAMSIQTNGWNLVERPGFAVSSIAVTAKCPETKRKFTFSTERAYKVYPKAVEVEAPPPVIRSKPLLRSPKAP